VSRGGCWAALAIHPAAATINAAHAIVLDSILVY
jgi:hypothetical protein